MNIYVLIDDKKKEPGARTYYSFDQKLFSEMNNLGWGIYFAVNDFGKNPRQDQYCERLRYVYGDLDIAKAGDGQTREQREEKKKIVLDALIAKCPPTMVVGTSNGLQPLWKIKDGILSNKSKYVNTIKGIIEWSKQFGCKADSVFDTARILRHPGFFHQKEEPFLCELIYQSEKVYSINELRNIFPFEEEVKKFIPTFTGRLSPVDEAINNINIQELVIRAFMQTGRKASFDSQDRLVLDGRQTGTFQGRTGDRGFIASSSHEPVKGNRVTVVADILGITPKEARLWIMKEYNLSWEREVAKKQIIKEVKPTKDYTLRYTWGTKGLDDKFAIIKRKTFIVLAARRGSGKTTVAFDMACKNAKLGHRVLFISLEMEKEHIKEDFARRRAGITIPEEREYRIPESKEKIYKEKIKEIDEITNLLFSGIQRGSDITWEGVKLLIAEHKDLDLVIIDNLDLIDKNPGEEENEKQKRIVKSVMNFTTDQQIPVILIHHYRKHGTGSGKDQGMDELSGSGKIADSADYVVKVSRTSEITEDFPDKYRTHVFLQKARGYSEAAHDIFFINGTFIDDPSFDDFAVGETAINESPKPLPIINDDDDDDDDVYEKEEPVVKPLPATDEDDMAEAIFAKW